MRSAVRLEGPDDGSILEYLAEVTQDQGPHITPPPPSPPRAAGATHTQVVSLCWGSRTPSAPNKLLVT